jgi:outer membrane protein TolC
LESRVSALNSSTKLFEEIKKKSSGSLQAMEIANAEYAVVQRQKDLVDAGRSVSDQEASLLYLMGIESKTHIVSIDPPSREEPKETGTQALKEALEQRLDLKQLQLALKTSQLQERVARHQTLPDLTINGGGGFTGTGGNFGESYTQIGDHPGTYWTVGLQFSYPLGNTAAKNDYLRNKTKTEQVQNQIKGLEWRIRNDVESDLRALISARVQIHMADKSLQLAEQRLTEYRKNNLAGTATVQDVINAENDLTSARNTQTDATETFANGVAKLWRDMGVLLDRQGVHIDTAHPEKLFQAGQGAPSRVAAESASEP